MSYTPPPILQFSLPMVSSASFFGNAARGAAATIANGAWPLANKAIFIPFRLSTGLLIKRLWVRVGTTGGTNTWDLGIYDEAGTRIVSMGSTTAGTASTIQFMDITDTYLGPGAYYMGMSSNGTTASFWGVTNFNVGVGKMLGLFEMATAHPLPATATYATFTGAAFPVCGYCTTASP